ncbi:MAG: hypothetical protein KC549_07065, partial [Myxococcales bacterium]|nr:hypothetical protein [Myxococcales bacterium]
VGGAGGEPACEPACDGRVCGPDGCGGRCGDCGDGAVCDDGVCSRAGCPDDEFVCGGDCADLLTDAAHCGSCGHDCAGDWPGLVGAAGPISFAAAGVTARCGAAECAFGCPGLRADSTEALLDALATDPNHCGRCGHACEHGTRNGQGDACVDAVCRCALADGEVGQICGDRCLVDTAGCAGGCCPTLAGEASVRLASDGYALRQYTFEVAARERVYAHADFDRCADTEGVLVRYLDDGRTEGYELGGTCFGVGFDGMLEPGFYGLILGREWEAGETVSAALERGDVTPAFVGAADHALAVGGFERVAFRLPTSGRWRVALERRGGACGREPWVALYNADGHPFFDWDADACQPVWLADFDAGTYILQIESGLVGAFALVVAPVETDAPPPDAIDRDGTLLRLPRPDGPADTLTLVARAAPTPVAIIAEPDIRRCSDWQGSVTVTRDGVVEAGGPDDDACLPSPLIMALPAGEHTVELDAPTGELRRLTFDFLAAPAPAGALSRIGTYPHHDFTPAGERRVVPLHFPAGGRLRVSTASEGGVGCHWQSRSTLRLFLQAGGHRLDQVEGQDDGWGCSTFVWDFLPGVPYELEVAGAGGAELGYHAVLLQSTEPPPVVEVPRDGLIVARGTYNRPGFAANSRDRLDVSFAMGGRVAISTAGPDGRGCPADTQLSLLRGGQRVANDDDGGEGGCSRLLVDLEAGSRYQVEVRHFSADAVPPYSLILQ